MQAAVIAGGRGTRLGSLTESLPKPMVEVHGKPFLLYELSLLKRSGISDFVLCVGYLGSKIQEYFQNGDKLGIRIRYSFDGEKPLGVMGALKKAEHLLADKFFMTYADGYLRADYRRAMELFERSDRLAMMFVFENQNKYGKSDVEVLDGRVVNFSKNSQTPEMTFINYGVTLLRKRALELVPENEESGEEGFFGKLIKKGELLAYEVYDRFYEIGTAQGLSEFGEYIQVELGKNFL